MIQLHRGISPSCSPSTPPPHPRGEIPRGIFFVCPKFRKCDEVKYTGVSVLKLIKLKKQAGKERKRDIGESVLEVDARGLRGKIGRLVEWVVSGLGLGVWLTQSHIEGIKDKVTGVLLTDYPNYAKIPIVPEQDAVKFLSAISGALENAINESWVKNVNEKLSRETFEQSFVAGGDEGEETYRLASVRVIKVSFNQHAPTASNGALPWVIRNFFAGTLTERECRRLLGKNPPSVEMLLKIGITATRGGTPEENSFSITFGNTPLLSEEILNLLGRVEKDFLKNYLPYVWYEFYLVESLMSIILIGHRVPKKTPANAFWGLENILQTYLDRYLAMEGVLGILRLEGRGDVHLYRVLPSEHYKESRLETWEEETHPELRDYASAIEEFRKRLDAYPDKLTYVVDYSINNRNSIFSIHLLVSWLARSVAGLFIMSSEPADSFAAHGSKHVAIFREAKIPEDAPFTMLGRAIVKVLNDIFNNSDVIEALRFASLSVREAATSSGETAIVARQLVGDNFSIPVDGRKYKLVCVVPRVFGFYADAERIGGFSKVDVYLDSLYYEVEMKEPGSAPREISTQQKLLPTKVHATFIPISIQVERFLHILIINCAYTIRIFRKDAPAKIISPTASVAVDLSMDDANFRVKIFAKLVEHTKRFLESYLTTLLGALENT